jgi:hypothetical protein
MMNFVEEWKLVNGSPVATTNGGITADYISVKNCHRVVIIADLLQAASHATALGFNEATAVDGTGAAAVTAVQKVWKNENIASTDTLEKGTDAATIAATAGTNNQQLVIEVDLSTLSAGFDCIAATLSDSSEATDFAVINYLCETRYPQATPPTQITN